MTARITIHGIDAFLDSSGAWASDNMRLAAFLTSSFSAELYPASPSSGTNPYGNQARAAAKLFGVAIVWEDSEEKETQEVIY